MSGIFLRLDDQIIPLKSFEGGGIRGEVERVDTGAEQGAKHIAAIRYEPLTIVVGLSMGTALAGWISSTLTMARTRMSGSIVLTTVDGKAQSYRHFTDALIEELTIPAIDASSREAGFFTLRLQPEGISYGKGDNVVITPAAQVRRKHWLPANFRLRIGALPCEHVSKIDSFTIRQRIVENPLGALSPVNTKEPVGLEFPNLKVTLGGADFDAWHDWFSEFVIRGHNDQSNELQGTLEFLDQSMKGTLGSVEFSHIGIFSLGPERVDSDREGLLRYLAELYVEGMTFKLTNV
jgi:hypothetical protein